jgi:hypothetical protein
MSFESIQSLIAVAIGFSVAGLSASGYRLITSQLPSFGLLQTGPRLSSFAAVPVLLFSAPFIIMRNTLIGRRHEGRRFEFVFAATLIAGFWSLMSGTVVVAALRVSGAL